MPQTHTGSGSIIIRQGFCDTERDRIASMYWTAFGPKLGRVLGSPQNAIKMLAGALDPSHALAARDLDGDRLLGVAGYKTAKGAFMNIDLPSLTRTYGWAGGFCRGLVLQILNRRQEPDTLLMDGIFVAEDARGLGVGKRLLDMIKTTARDRDCRSVRLDVINTNPRARALYEREGFCAVKTINLGPLRHLFGFDSATTMVAEVA